MRVARIAPVLFAASCGDPAPIPGGPCDGETRALTYTPGLEIASGEGAFRATLLDVDAGAPVRGKNAWTLGIDPEGDTPPLDQLEVVVEPFMPDHGHGSALAPEISRPSDGVVLAESIDLFMAGLWEVRVIARWTDGAVGEREDRALFTFCIE